MPGLADIESMEQFVAQRGASGFEHIPDVDGAIWKSFGVIEHRSYVLINDDGTQEITGYGSLEEDVQALIAR